MTAKLHKPARQHQLHDLLVRLGIIGLVLFVTVVAMYIEGGHKDARTGEAPDFVGCIYFTMVTITTVGYGDIVPVTTFARLVDAFVLTPIRFFVFLLFVGFAYQFAFKRLQEDYLMKLAVKKLQEHIIVCGYGETGRAAVEELLLQGTPPGQLVVIDTNEDALDRAARHEVVAVAGDATRERVLKDVAIERASHVLICPGRDDTAVLIALTAHDLNPRAQLVVMCHEAENVRLVERSGANTIISPASAGGNLMAAATRQKHIVNTMKDILTVGGTLRMDERLVREDEVGKHPSELEGLAAVRVYRDGAHFDLTHFPTLESGDILVFVTGGEPQHGG